jgi:hypothetical protein
MSGGSGVRARQEDGGLEHKRRRELAGAPELAESLEHAEIGDEERPDAQPHSSANLGDSGVDPGAPARDSARGARDERLAAGVPCSAGAEEERDLDASVRPQPRELAGSRRR